MPLSNCHERKTSGFMDYATMFLNDYNGRRVAFASSGYIMGRTSGPDDVTTLTNLFKESFNFGVLPILLMALETGLLLEHPQPK